MRGGVIYQELSRFNQELSRFKQELSRFNQELSRFDQELSMFKQELSMFKQELSRFKQELSRFDQELSRFNSVLEQMIFNYKHFLRNIENTKLFLVDCCRLSKPDLKDNIQNGLKHVIKHFTALQTLFLNHYITGT